MYCTYVCGVRIYWLLCVRLLSSFFFFKQKTAYEMRISDWSSDVCSSDLARLDNNVPVPVNRLRRHDEPGAAGVLVPGWRGLETLHHRGAAGNVQIGRASCRERVCQYV